MSDRKTETLAFLENSRETLKRVLVQLQPEDWEKTVQDEDQKWTVRQILVHLADSHKGLSNQLMAFVEGRELIPPDFDLNRWNRRTVEKGADKTPAELIQVLEVGHTRLKEIIAGLNDTDFDKKGRHSSLQIMSVEELTRQIGDHEAAHARTIAERLGLSLD